MATRKGRKPALKGKKGEPWYAKYIRTRIREVFHWSPERKKAKDRARIPASNVALESYRCEECNNQPLTRNQVEFDHTDPCEHVEGFDVGGKWNGLIARTLDVTADGIKVLCKQCHYKKSASENALRRKHKKNQENPNE
jgi:hypothetical protein